MEDAVVLADCPRSGFVSSECSLTLSSVGKKETLEECSKDLREAVEMEKTEQRNDKVNLAAVGEGVEDDDDDDDEDDSDETSLSEEQQVQLEALEEGTSCLESTSSSDDDEDEDDNEERETHSTEEEEEDGGEEEEETVELKSNAVFLHGKNLKPSESSYLTNFSEDGEEGDEGMMVTSDGCCTDSQSNSVYETSLSAVITQTLPVGDSVSSSSSSSISSSRSRNGSGSSSSTSRSNISSSLGSNSSDTKIDEVMNAEDECLIESADESTENDKVKLAAAPPSSSKSALSDCLNHLSGASLMRNQLFITSPNSATAPASVSSDPTVAPLSNSSSLQQQQPQQQIYEVIHQTMIYPEAKVPIGTTSSSKANNDVKVPTSTGTEALGTAAGAVAGPGLTEDRSHPSETVYKTAAKPNEKAAEGNLYLFDSGSAVAASVADKMVQPSSAAAVVGGGGGIGSNTDCTVCQLQQQQQGNRENEVFVHSTITTTGTAAACSSPNSELSSMMELLPKLNSYGSDAAAADADAAAVDAGSDNKGLIIENRRNPSLTMSCCSERKAMVTTAETQQPMNIPTIVVNQPMSVAISAAAAAAPAKVKGAVGPAEKSIRFEGRRRSSLISGSKGSAEEHSRVHTAAGAAAGTAAAAEDLSKAGDFNSGDFNSMPCSSGSSSQTWFDMSKYKYSTQVTSSSILREEYPRGRAQNFPTRYVSVPEEENRETRVVKREVVENLVECPKEVIEYVEKIVEVPQIEYYDRLVDVEVVQHRVVEKIVSKVVDKPVEVVKYVKKIIPQVVEKIKHVDEIIYVDHVLPTPRSPKFVDRHKHVVVAQTVRPVITESAQYQEIDIYEYVPEIVEVPVAVAKPLPQLLLPGGESHQVHQPVTVPVSQYNTILKSLNPHVASEVLPFISTNGGSFVEFMDSNQNCLFAVAENDVLAAATSNCISDPSAASTVDHQSRAVAVDDRSSFKASSIATKVTSASRAVPALPGKRSSYLKPSRRANQGRSRARYICCNSGGSSVVHNGSSPSVKSASVVSRLNSLMMKREEPKEASQVGSRYVASLLSPPPSLLPRVERKLSDRQEGLSTQQLIDNDCLAYSPPPPVAPSSKAGSRKTGRQSTSRRSSSRSRSKAGADGAVTDLVSKVSIRKHSRVPRSSLISSKLPPVKKAQAGVWFCSGV